jgi:predicted small lipoprotein YifL
MKWLAPIGCLVALLIAGCGQKGALYLPDKKGAAVTGAPAAAAPPAATPQPKKPTDPDDPNGTAPPAK